MVLKRGLRQGKYAAITAVQISTVVLEFDVSENMAEGR